MNEQAYFQELIRERAVDDAKVKAAVTAARRPRFVWRRALTVAAGAAAVLIATVFTIPSTRAEVLSWFKGPSSPQDYLTASEDEHAVIPEIEALIATPEPQAVVPVPIDRTESEAVNSEAAMQLSAFLYENCDIRLGNAMYDGKSFFQTIRLNGLSGLPILSELTNSTDYAIPVDPQRVWGLYENGPEEEYLNGEETLYEWPEAWVWYELPDGKRWRGMAYVSNQTSYDMIDHWDTIKSILHGMYDDPRTEEEAQAVDAANRAYLEKNGLTVVAKLNYPNFSLLRYADEDGNVTFKVIYSMTVIEDDHAPDTDLFEAEIGTVTINMRSYEQIEANSFRSDDSIVFGGETVTVSKWGCDWGEVDWSIDGNAPGGIMSLYKQRVSLEGVTMTPEMNEAVIDSLGIRNIKIRFTFPESWTMKDRDAFAESLFFEVLLNGQSGKWQPGSFRRELQDDGTVLFTIYEMTQVPYDMLSSIETIRLIPVIESIESYDLNDPVDHHYVGTLEPAYGETAYGPEGVTGGNAHGDTHTFDRYALTLQVN